jgi:hypothetical protein
MQWAIGGSYITSASYRGLTTLNRYSGTQTETGGTDTTSFLLSTSLTFTSFNISFDVYHKSGSFTPSYNGLLAGTASSDEYVIQTGGYLNSTGLITGIRFSSTNNISTNTIFRIYGIA